MTLNYLSVGADASPVEVLRVEAVDAVLTRFFAQRGTARAGGGVVSMVAMFSAGRLDSVTGVSFDIDDREGVCGGSGVGCEAAAGSAEQFRLSARDLQESLESLCAAMDGPGGVPTVIVMWFNTLSDGFGVELAYRTEARSAWDVAARGVGIVAQEVAALCPASA